MKDFIEWEKIYTSYSEVEDRKDLPSWFKEYFNHIGDKFKTSNGSVFVLKGMAETDEDLYYYGLDDNGKVIYHTCVDKIERIGI